MNLFGKFLFAAAAMPLAVAAETAPENYRGEQSLIDCRYLPFRRTPGVRTHYEGSIDKRGGNADWDWHLYQDENGEWVIFDVDGPGCLYNFVQHRYPTSPEPVFRFYFDGEKEPAFVIRQSEFGKKFPFVPPLADVFVGPEDGGRGPIWVVRSFVPMAFARSCRITSSVKLEGNDKAAGGGGWGHVMYQSYPDAAGVATFRGSGKCEAVLEAWRRSAGPWRDGDCETVTAAGEVPGHARQTILEQAGPGAIAAIAFRIPGLTPAMRHSLRVRLYWENEPEPAVDLPFGAFFGNELGYHDIELPLLGSTVDGRFYNRFPMPFWQYARLDLVNTAEMAVAFEAEVKIVPPAVFSYPAEQAMHFRASAYYPAQTQVLGDDSVIAVVRGSGHLAAAVVTCPGDGFCEGDVRVYFDDFRTPQIESDGSESYVCYGWGFVAPPQQNPVTAYDGTGNDRWNMVRLTFPDAYCFHTKLRFGIEDRYGANTTVSTHSGALLYYGEHEPDMVETDGFVPGDGSHAYRVADSAETLEVTSSFEGDAWDVPFTFRGFGNFERSEFCVRVLPGNRGVILRRVSDQRTGRQAAEIYVDGVKVKERLWYFADRNPFCRLLEDEFVVPAAYTAGKAQLKITVRPVDRGAGRSWNELEYRVFSLL
ncbi:DUF2961 domain-containing protein [Victivallis sp. Marseille-Q1083]|uniref:DUF2961 domain-containing protein n=1 Tax=Victivallis sp. Marseille-Q1083 TaxID=2717288 RepID=UPI00158BE997|nr:DUF2961 domain-containing protein [Victivallis sp. Marseille-Q1083]